MLGYWDLNLFVIAASVLPWLLWILTEKFLKGGMLTKRQFKGVRHYTGGGAILLYSSIVPFDSNPKRLSRVHSFHWQPIWLPQMKMEENDVSGGPESGTAHSPPIFLLCLHPTRSLTLQLLCKVRSHQSCPWSLPMGLGRGIAAGTCGVDVWDGHNSRLNERSAGSFAGLPALGFVCWKHLEQNLTESISAVSCWLRTWDCRGCHLPAASRR